MISEIFTAMLITSLSGSCLAAVILLARPLTKRVFGYSWHYYIWLTVLFTMLLPVRFSLPRTADIVPSVPAAVQSGQSVQTEQDTNIAASVPQEDTKTELLQTGTRFFAGIIDNRMDIIAYIWLAGAVTLLSVNLTGFIRLAWQIRKNSALIPCPELEGFTKRKVSVRVWERTSSPFMVGVIKPTLVLPARNLTDKQLNNILRHEMTHLRRHDILYKWLVVLVKCLHWFNPMIWAAAKQIDAECEISCDMAVTRSMNRDEEMSYIDTILSLLPVRQSKRLSITTQMAGSKRMLERRFMMMKTKRTTSKLVSAVSAAVAAAMLSTTVFAGGVLSGLTGDDYTVEITNNGEVIELANKPFIENGEVYLPLRETFERVGVMEHEGSFVVWDNGKLSVVLTPGAGHEEMVSYDFDIQINEKNIQYGILRETLAGNEMMYCPPVMKGSVTYVPYELIDLMLNHRYNNEWSIEYTVFDTDGAERTMDVINNIPRKLCSFEARLLSPDYENEQTLSYEVTCAFFDLLQIGDIKNMKAYCTPAFAERELTDDTLLGYRSGTMWSVYSVYLYADGNYRVTVSFYPSNDVTDESDRVILSAIVAIQEDGSALIDGIETGS